MEGTAFRCFRCGDIKKSKLITIYSGDWSRKLCNGCYGRLLSLYEIKAGTVADDIRVDRLAEMLLSLATVDQQHEATRRELLIGPQGVLRKLVLSTERHK
jgi:hypothetical protein